MTGTGAQSARRSLRWIVAGGLAIAMVGTVGSVPASAREQESVDVTDATTSDFWVDVSDDTVNGGYCTTIRTCGAILRSEDYSTSPRGRYVYAVNVGNVVDSGKRCVLTRDGAVIVDGKCRDVSEWEGPTLAGSGTYVLTLNGRTIATFTFRQPGDRPPRLAPPACVIKSVKPGALVVGDPQGYDGQWFTVSTNGRCSKGGYWYAEWWDARGGETYSRIKVPPSGEVFLLGLDPVLDVRHLEFVFYPRGYVQLSAYALETPPGPVFAWTRVPSIEGY